MAKRKAGAGRKSRAMREMLDRSPPADYIVERRRLFSFVQAPPDSRQDGRNGEIDSEVRDGLGQLHALGLLDGHGFDGKDLRDAGWFYGEHYWNRYHATAPKTGKYERSDMSVSAWLGETAADRRFDRMDCNLTGHERQVLMSLVVDKVWTDEIVPWAQALIDEALLERGRVRRGVVRFPDQEDRAMLLACIRGLCAIYDGGMEMRRAA
jgi:hypothetical protein